MLDPFSSLGIAIIVLYAPALIASFVLVFRHGEPRRAWIFLTALSASRLFRRRKVLSTPSSSLINISVRVASGIIVIIRERNAHDMDTLAIATATLLSVGVYPLLLALLGLFCIM